MKYIYFYSKSGKFLAQKTTRDSIKSIKENENSLLKEAKGSEYFVVCNFKDQTLYSNKKVEKMKKNAPLTDKEIELGRKLSSARFNEETGEFYRKMGQYAENPGEIVIVSNDEVRKDIDRAFQSFAEFGCD